MYLSIEREVNGNLSSLDVEISRQQGKLMTTVYRKPILSGVYTHFSSFFANSTQSWYDIHSSLPMFQIFSQLDKISLRT